MRASVLASAATLVLALLFLTWRLDQRELYSSHEARAAMNADSLLRGARIPHLYDGSPDLQKPPLYYGLVAGIAWMRGGVDALAVRLPAALAAWGIVALLLSFAWHLGRPLVGLFAAWSLLIGIHFPWLARIGRIDMPLAFAVTLSVLSFWLALRGQRGWLWSAYGGIALGVLLKGPIGLLLPLVIVAAWLVVQRRWPTDLALVPGMLGVALACIPIYLWMQYESKGRFFHEFLWLHNIQRGLGGSRLRAHPCWHYVPYLLLYLLPMTPLLLVGLFSRARRDPLARAGLLWLMASLLLLSLARFKRADYLVPVYPGVALFLGVLLERWYKHRPRSVLAGFIVAVVLSWMGWLIYLGKHLPAEAAFRDYGAMARVIREQAEPHPVLYFQAEAHALMFRVGQP
ncbi:MAG: glycosyltransferase family 39 protein, partial [Gemmataceae bacterium]